MKKTILAIFAALATVFGAAAADYAYTLVVNKSDGSKVNFLFENNPVATFDNENLNITEVMSGLEFSYPLSDVVDMTFDKELIPDGVENLDVSESNVAFGLNKETLDVYGAPEGTLVNIYDLKGALRAQGFVNADKKASVSIAGLEHGAYIVKAGNNTFKFIH